MPFSNNRRYYIVGVIIFVVIAAIIINGAMSSAPNKKNIKESEIITVTIEKSVGINRIIYENINNPGEGKTLTIVTLPHSFNCTRGDTLYFFVTTREGYQWDTWDFLVTGRSNTDNALWLTAGDPLYCLNNQISMTPSCIPLRVSPTSTPSPSPSPTPIE